MDTEHNSKADLSAAFTAAEANAAAASPSSTPRSIDSSSQPNLLTLVTAAAAGNIPTSLEGRPLTNRSHRGHSNSQSNTPRSTAGTSNRSTKQPKKGGLTGLPPRKATGETPRSMVAAAATSSSRVPATSTRPTTGANKLDMRDDMENDIDAELAAQLLNNDSEDSEWETEEADTPSFAQLCAAAEVAARSAPATKLSKAPAKAAPQQPVLTLFGINLLEHFDRSYLIGAGLVLGACVGSIAVLSIKAHLR